MDLTSNYKLTTLKHVDKVPVGLDAFVSQLVGKFRSRHSIIQRILREACEIDKQSQIYKNATDDELRKKIKSISEVFKRRVDKASFHEAISLIQEAVLRTMGYRPYVEQLAGVICLYKGYIAEMSTGEGKTITAAICATLRGFSGMPCHVITANDYLASRDALIMKPLYDFCGVSVGVVTSQMNSAERKIGYAASVTYSTAKEVLADFLRDRIAMGKAQFFSKRILDAFSLQSQNFGNTVVQRGLSSVIVDEADNVLIDEAVTPLIISKENKNQGFDNCCRRAYELSLSFVAGKDYLVDEKLRTIHFLKNMDECLVSENAGGYFKVPFLKDLIRQALIARHFFISGRQYVIENEKVVIVDESTGRKMPMRSWNGGLHQMIELKENLEMSGLKETEARMSFQRFFRLYKNFSGMTGTGRESLSEFWTVYGAPVLCVPNHRRCLRKLSALKIFASKDMKRVAILHEIMNMHELGRPVLVGTKDIDESEIIADMVTSIGLSCRVINAVRCDEEASIIADAGKMGSITIATNMAGRGTDIKITEEVKKLGGLHVIATECNSSSRIDRQLFGRAARQGDPGSAGHYASFEDDVLKRNLPVWLLKSISHFRFFSLLAVKWAQHSAGRKAMKSRLAVQRTDSWLEDSLGFSGNSV